MESGKAERLVLMSNDIIKLLAKFYGGGDRPAEVAAAFGLAMKSLYELDAPSAIVIRHIIDKAVPLEEPNGSNSTRLQA